MKEIIILSVITGLAFFLFGLTLVFGFIKKNKNLKLTSLVILITFIGLASLTAYKFLTKSYNKVADTFKSRTGDEIYDALFDKRKTNCVNVINCQDQVVPKIDYAPFGYNFKLVLTS